MLHIHIICLGKLKEHYWRDAENEYTKRLKPFVKLTIHELKEESFGEKDAPEKVKQKEAHKIVAEIEKLRNSEIIVLDEQGQQFSSVDFSKKLADLTIKQTNNIVFVVGGPLGLNEEIKKQASILLSFSKMTFTHQMIRVVLLEALYRAMMIQNNRTYHY